MRENLKKCFLLMICMILVVSTPVFAEPEDGTAFKKRIPVEIISEGESWGIGYSSLPGELADNQHYSKDKKYIWTKHQLGIGLIAHPGYDRVSELKYKPYSYSYFTCERVKNRKQVMKWEKIDGKWYYFTNLSGKYTLGYGGRMAANEWINGYYFNKNGTWTRKNRAFWKQNKKGWKYKDKTGWYAKNCKLFIDGKWYYFDSKGYRVTGWKKIGKYWYFFNTKGQMVVNKDLVFKKTQRAYHFCYNGVSIPYRE